MLSAALLMSDGDSLPQKPTISFEGLEPISASSFAQLSRAAKKNIIMQQQILQNGSGKFRHAVKSSQEERRKMKSDSRSNLRSAPAQFQHGKGDALLTLKQLPQIILIEPSPQSSVQSYKNGKKSNKKKIKEEKKQRERVLSDEEEVPEAPPSAMSVETSNIDIETPIAPSEANPLQTSPLETPRAAVSFTDWAWVRERLASRESVLARPESSLTFHDFLDVLMTEADEDYDTDLEEDFEDVDSFSEDRTGLWHYQKMCRRKGLTPAFQIVQKLSDENISLSFNHRGLNNKDTFALAIALTHNKVVQKLNLSGNSMDDSSAKHIANMLKRNNTIVRLDMSNNCLREDRENHISEMLQQNKTLTHVFLSNNKLGDQEALLLCEVLRCKETLQYLDLSHNQFSDIAGQSFAAALMDNQSLNSLNLAWNTLGRKSGSCIGKAMKVNKHLKSLDLSYNGLGDDGAALLGRPLRYNSTLIHLSLAVNHIGPFGVERLASGIIGGRNKKMKKSVCALRTLILDRNPLGRKGVSAFIKHMQQSEKLIDLSIKEVVLSPEVLLLARQLMSSRTIALFYEGQDEEESRKCAIQFGVIVFRQILKQNRIKLYDFFNSLDPTGKGLKMDQLKRSIQSLRVPPTELELERLIQNFQYKRTICYEDLAKYATLPAVTKPPKQSKTRKKYSISRF